MIDSKQGTYMYTVYVPLRCSEQTKMLFSKHLHFVQFLFLNFSDFGDIQNICWII